MSVLYVHLGLCRTKESDHFECFPTSFYLQCFLNRQSRWSCVPLTFADWVIWKLILIKWVMPSWPILVKGKQKWRDFMPNIFQVPTCQKIDIKTGTRVCIKETLHLPQAKCKILELKCVNIETLDTTTYYTSVQYKMLQCNYFCPVHQPSILCSLQPWYLYILPLRSCKLGEEERKSRKGGGGVLSPTNYKIVRPHIKLQHLQ